MRKKLNVKTSRKGYKTKEELPMLLTASDIRSLSGLSQAKIYQLFHSEDFPTIKIDGRMFAKKEDFFKWIDTKKNKLSAV